MADISVSCNLHRCVRDSKLQNCLGGRLLQSSMLCVAATAAVPAVAATAGHLREHVPLALQ